MVRVTRWSFLDATLDLCIDHLCHYPHNVSAMTPPTVPPFPTIAHSAFGQIWLHRFSTDDNDHALHCGFFEAGLDARKRVFQFIRAPQRLKALRSLTDLYKGLS